MIPEIIIDKPHPTNNFKWCWCICVPEANYGVLYEGDCDDYNSCVNKARFYYNLVLNELKIKII